MLLSGEVLSGEVWFRDSVWAFGPMGRVNKGGMVSTIPDNMVCRGIVRELDPSTIG